MILKTLIASVFLVLIVMLALGVKLLFDKDAKFTVHSCGFEDSDSIDEDGACSHCQLKDLSDCPEKKTKDNPN